MHKIQTHSIRHGQLLVYLILSLGALIIIVPFFWLLTGSIKTLSEAYEYPPAIFPEKPQWNNFVSLIKDFGFGRAALNSIIQTVSVIIIQMITSTTAAFAFSRLEFRFREVLFLLYLATLMIPMHLRILPLYLLTNKLGWTNTYAGLIYPGVFSAFGVFLLRQFFKAIPKEFDDAVRIDGGGPFRIFWSVIVPLSKPAIATLTIFSFLEAWNALLWPLIIMSKEAMYTIPLALAMFSGNWVTKFHLQMAGAVIAIIPILGFFLFAQKYLINSVTLSGLKN